MVKMKQINRYPLDQCCLYKCRSKKRLAKVLNIEPGTIHKIHEYIKYHNFEISKNDEGDKRKISSPNHVLKEVQQNILKKMVKIKRPDWLISGEKGKSYITNAKYHQNGIYALTIDIKSFYDNCQREYVYRFFKDKLEMESDIAALVTDIVTYEKRIPTGTPTSQLISYYAYEDMFNEINEIAFRHGCKFSLYVDDMSFSSVNSFEYKLLMNDVEKTLKKYGHRLKKSKVNYYGKKDVKTYTGVVINTKGELTVPNKLRKKVYENFQNVKNEDVINFGDKTTYKTYQTLVGQLNAAKNIEKGIFPEIDRITKQKKISERKTTSLRLRKRNSTIKL